MKTKQNLITTTYRAHVYKYVSHTQLFDVGVTIFIWTDAAAETQVKELTSDRAGAEAHYRLIPKFMLLSLCCLLSEDTRCFS